MDKKNTMLLTVIAVATLLVAVVGATFAYFSVTGTNTTTNTGAQVTVTKYSQVALSGGTAGLKLNLLGKHMAESAQNTYYAVTNGTAEPATSAQNHNVATATLGLTEGDPNTYYCAWNVNVSAEDTGLLTALNAESSNNTTAKVVITGAGLNETFDLKELTTAKKFTAETTLKAGTLTENITADVYLKNENFSQNNLSDKGVTITITNTGFNCDTASMPAPKAA